MFCSNVYAVLNNVSSSKGFVNICRPIGRPDFVNPHGIEIPGIPDKFAGIVNISERYMLRGSFNFSPNLNAAVGDVGVIMQSNFLKALSKSSFIFVLTFCAFK